MISVWSASCSGITWRLAASGLDSATANTSSYLNSGR
ncbi:Uncharacterised protein [Bordetella pertussis]|nr:Uncharacterised protein [Bordetella pertussis]